MNEDDELMNEKEDDEFTPIYMRKSNVFKAQIPYKILRGVFFFYTYTHAFFKHIHFYQPTTSC